jgi:hypothetical protein
MGRPGEAEVAFLKRARDEVEAYLRHFEVAFVSIGATPSWALPPHLAVWPIYGENGPIHPGWYAISGDVPTDYVSSSDAPDARAAVWHFARLWREVAATMASGRAHPEMKIGTPEQWPTLHSRLHERALLLAEFAADDSLWP